MSQPLSHPWRRSMHAKGSRYPESRKATEEADVDRRVADLLRRCGPMSAKALGQRLGVSHHVTRASVQRLKCAQEGSGSMTRWRLPC